MDQGPQQMAVDTDPLIEEVPTLQPAPMQGIQAVQEGMAMPEAQVPQQGPAEAAQPAEDPNRGEYTYRVANFSRQGHHVKLHSENFTIGGFPWRLLIFPRGNKETSAHTSVFLDVGDAEMLPPGWQRRANFRLTLINQLDAGRSLVKETGHTFSGAAVDWGFNQFAPLHEVLSASSGFLVDDTLVIKVEVTVDHDTLSYDSKKETGFVGIKNQGATCYMNSLLQTLYCINYFRRAVYHMPTAEEEVTAKSLPLALQSLFYKLQFGSQSVSTKDLTKSFGWDQSDAFYQHDVQELNRILCEKLEDKMKNTKVQGAISHLFEGHMQSFIQCVNVDYKSVRRETFMDLSLDIKGCKDVYESFERFTEVEMMDGENQYKAEGHGMQDAKKGILFEDFPPVLQLQLKRFEYDMQRDLTVKVNDRFAFPEELDLDYQDRKFLAAEARAAEHPVRNRYCLHSVLVHSGGVHGGHYYGFIITPDGKQWLKFDDDRVTKVRREQAVDEQYGGEDDSPPPAPGFNAHSIRFTKFSNAYCLVYIRESAWDEIMVQVDKDEIAAHVRARLEAEAADKERRKREKAEAHLHIVVRLSTFKDLQQQVGNTLFFDLADHGKARQMRVKKQELFGEFRRQVAAELGVPQEQMRLWTWWRRQNNTLRPSAVLGPELDQRRMMDLRHDASQRVTSLTSEMFIFVEQAPPEKPLLDRQLERDGKSSLALLFFKFYVPETKQLQLVAHRLIPKSARIRDLFQFLRDLVQLPPNTPLRVFEEVKFDPSVMCEDCEPAMTVQLAQLDDGDILVFQRALPQEEADRLPCPTAREFLEWVRNRQLVCFKRLENSKEEGVTLELSKAHTYDEVTLALAQALQLPDHTRLRLTGSNPYMGGPKPNPMQFRDRFERLEQVCEVRRRGEDNASHTAHTEVIYFEVLDISLQELESLKTLKLGFHNERGEHASQHSVRLPKEALVRDVLAEVARLVPSLPQDVQLRMLEIGTNKIFKVFDDDERIEQINDNYWQLRVEVVPKDQADSLDRLIHVYHVSADAQNHHQACFGDPLFMRVGEHETLAELKLRIQQLLGVSDEEFSKWRFSFNTSLRPTEYLGDDEVVAERFPAVRGNSRYPTGGDVPYLGLEHKDLHPHRHHRPNR